MSLGISRKQMVMVATLLSGTLLTVLNLTLMTPALPTIMADMSVSAETVQWLTSGYGMVEAVVITLCGERIGRFWGVFRPGSFFSAAKRCLPSAALLPPLRLRSNSSWQVV